MQSYLAWLQRHGAYIHPSLEIRTDDNTGSGVFLRKNAASVKEGTLLSELPLSLLLSAANSTLNERKYLDLKPHLALAAHLLHETCLEGKSQWAEYIAILPTKVDLPMCWEKEALEWLKGTETERDLERDVCVSGIRDTFTASILPNLPVKEYSATPTFQKYLHCVTLVLSRAFFVDNYHKLAMVPFADAFNHSDENHVQLESDQDVCADCGALWACRHGKSEQEVFENETKTTQSVEMHAEVDIMQNSERQVEVFNTYGPLPNARLLTRYGFMIEGNEYDTISWDNAEEVLLCLRVTAKSDQLSTFFKYARYRTADFSIDCDGQFSKDLWTFLAILAAPEQAIPDLTAATSCVAALFSVLDDSADSEKLIDIGRTTNINNTIHLANTLVANRLSKVANHTMAIDEIFSLYDETEESQSSKRLAMKANLQDRLCLRACQGQLAELCGHFK